MQHFPPLAAAALLAAGCAALTACGGIAVVDGQGSGGGGAGAGGAGAGGGLGGADCFQQLTLDDEDPPFSDCDGVPDLCPPLQVTDSSVGQDTFQPPEAATCILTMLRDRTPGRFLIVVQDGSHQSFLQAWLYGDAFGGQEGYLLPGPDAPMPELFRWSRKMQLKAPQVFEDCLNNPITGQVWAFCLSEWWTGCVDQDAACE